jgi:hypothetical protein
LVASEWKDLGKGHELARDKTCGFLFYRSGGSKRAEGTCTEVAEEFWDQHGIQTGGEGMAVVYNKTGKRVTNQRSSEITEDLHVVEIRRQMPERSSTFQP